MLSFRRLIFAAIVAATISYLSCMISWSGNDGATSSQHMVSMVRQMSLELTQLRKSKAVAFTHVKEQEAQIIKQATEIRRLGQLLLTPSPISHSPPPPSPPPPPPPPPPSPASSLLTKDDATTNFLVASQIEKDDGQPHYARRLLRNMLGMAALLNRTLILPSTVCDCSDTALQACTGAPNELFGCPLKAEIQEGIRDGLASLLPTRAVSWITSGLPEELRCSHVRVLLNPGLDSEQLAHALRHYSNTRVLEVRTLPRSTAQSPTL